MFLYTRENERRRGTRKQENSRTTTRAQAPTHNLKRSQRGGYSDDPIVLDLWLLFRSAAAGSYPCAESTSIRRRLSESTRRSETPTTTTTATQLTDSQRQLLSGAEKIPLRGGNTNDQADLCPERLSKLRCATGRAPPFYYIHSNHDLHEIAKRRARRVQSKVAIGAPLRKAPIST
ncbi:unnamed protein product [Trichogramma brassicae]|uniref:Uncharacterized protein n=1 Tax=Trichogramma brassicae TaxID=86971 RepID=A0A6H5HYI3_9HYME|nr:unnamed protein product [Trichogramma brassicae]